MIRLTAVLCCIFVLVSLLRCGSSQSSSTVSIGPSASVTPSINQSHTVVTTTPSPGVSASSSSDSSHISYNTTASHFVTAPTASRNVTPASPSPTQKPDEKKFEATIKVNDTYLPDYYNLTSNDSITFVRNFKSKLDSLLRQRLSNFKDVNVLQLSNGSVVVRFEIVVWKPSNATVKNIIQALKEGNGTSALGYILIGDINVTALQSESSSTSSTGTVTTATTAPVTPAAPTSSTKGTEIWDKAIDYVTPLGTFIIVIVAVALLLILLAALIYICCKYRKLKKRTRFPHHMTINDADWIRSNDDLLMWEQNLRASEVKTNNGITNRPYNEKRT